MRQKLFASTTNGISGFPLFFASRIAPALATCGGPFGPSSVNPIGKPSFIRRIILVKARIPPRVEDPRTAP
jgi:hypothetical protein